MTTNRKAGQVYHSNPNVGVTEKEIVRIAHLLSFGGTLRDVRDLYAKEGWPIDNCSMVYCAAKVYLKIRTYLQSGIPVAAAELGTYSSGDEGGSSRPGIISYLKVSSHRSSTEKKYEQFEKPSPRRKLKVWRPFARLPSPPSILQDLPR